MRYYQRDFVNQEVIEFDQCWTLDGLDWFCRVMMNGIKVEAYGGTKRQALRKARRFHNKIKNTTIKADGWPRVLESGE